MKVIVSKPIYFSLEIAKLKILICTLNFPPELIGIAKYTGEMSEWLSASKNDVRVVTAFPYYPEWRLSRQYKSTFWRYELFGSVGIWRCPLWVPSNPSGLKRILHLASFALSSFPVLLIQIFWRPQVVFVVEPPLMMTPGALLLSKITNAISILHVQDFEVDAAFQLGVLKGNLIKKIILKIEAYLMSKFTCVTSISTKMIKCIKEKGVDSNRVFLFPNWVDLSMYTASESAISIKAQTYRRNLDIPSDAIVALYSGTMGLKQGLDLLAELAKKTINDKNCSKNVHFVFCGDGPGRKTLMESCGNLNNVHFLKFQPHEDLPSLLSMADIHLLPQRGDLRDFVLPSKLTGMLASGRPILACANINTELERLVKGCGIVVPPDNLQYLYEGFMLLINNPELRKSFGFAGRAYALEHLDRFSVLTSFETKIKELLLI